VLESLHIRNLAIIDDLVVGFGPGLNVLTGETGAGKSILIGAIQLLLGAKAGAEMIRQGAEEASVEGFFLVSGDSRAGKRLKAQGFEVDEGMVVRRVLTRAGRSRAYLNGQSCTLPMLAELLRDIVNIYGQHEHQGLLQPERHLDLLDEHGRLLELRSDWENLWSRWMALRNRILEAETSVREALSRKELWEFQLKEIKDARLVPGEAEALEQERLLLLNAERLQNFLSRAQESLYAERGSALERVHMAIRELEELLGIAPALGAVIGDLKSAEVQLQEAVSRIRDQARNVQYDQGRLAQLEERLEEIQRLRRKYRTDVDGILALAEHLGEQLREADLGEELLEGLRLEMRDLEQELSRVGEELSLARQKAGEELALSVQAELKDLGADQPVFQVLVSRLEEGQVVGEAGLHAGPRGMDKVEFRLSMNVGEPPRPLWRIASGGELSRIMLAMKKVLAEAERVPTLILDEIDAGIGGAVAHALGEKLAHIGRSHQVLCVTHLPQVACFARHHFRVLKQLKKDRTVTEVWALDREGRVEELSRMLGGKVVSSKARAHARELLEKAGN
jgi:DNA repair protein RecN (Recombination protein N)